MVPFFLRSVLHFLATRHPQSRVVAWIVEKIDSPVILFSSYGSQTSVQDSIVSSEHSLAVLSVCLSQRPPFIPNALPDLSAVRAPRLE